MENNTTPKENGESCAFANDGLTKREYFAGLAMQGLLSIFNDENSIVPNEENVNYMATLSVKAADALLSTLSK